MCIRDSAGDTEPTRFDLYIADRVDRRTTATLNENGSERLRWRLDDTVIAGDGRDLRKLSKWKHELPPQEAEWATLLRRGLFVSGARQYVPPPAHVTAFEGPGRMGACFNYQLPQARQSTRSKNWHKDFSLSGEPLEGLDPVREFRTMAPT